MMIWLNLNSKSEVNKFYEQWKETQGGFSNLPPRISMGNLFRVFYAFSRDVWLVSA
jgi:hypothetical protein